MTVCRERICTTPPSGQLKKRYAAYYHPQGRGVDKPFRAIVCDSSPLWAGDE